MTVEVPVMAVTVTVFVFGTVSVEVCVNVPTVVVVVAVVGFCTVDVEVTVDEVQGVSGNLAEQKVSAGGYLDSGRRATYGKDEQTALGSVAGDGAGAAVAERTSINRDNSQVRAAMVMG